jgi:hypothetical protein
MNHTRRDFFSVMGWSAISLKNFLVRGQEKSPSLAPLKLPKISAEVDPTWFKKLKKAF